MSNKKKNNTRTVLYILLGLFIVLDIVLLVYLAGTIINYKNTAEKDSLKTGESAISEEYIKEDNAGTNEEPAITENSKDNKIENIINNMSLKELIYQMMFVTPESITGAGNVIAAGSMTQEALKNYPVGGIIYFSANLIDRQQTSDMIKNSQSFSEIPLFIAVDEEGGIVQRLGSNSAMGTTRFPPMAEIGATNDPSKAMNVGVTIGREIKELGFNVDFAPDADVLINTSNTEIGSRSFGTDPELVASMASSCAVGLESTGVSAAMKHFPGHGSTYVNSHSGYSESTRTLEELKSSEFIPFIAGINSNVDFIMVSHMTLVNATEEKVPCSVSGEVISDWLLGDLNYKGIVITDSFSMGAITDKYTSAQAAVKAVNAGVDMILMPYDIEDAYKGIEAAIKNGDISEDRIKTSVRKILKLKEEKGLI